VFHPIEEPGPDDRVIAVETNPSKTARGCRFSLRSMLIAFFVIALLLWLGPILLLRMLFGVGPVWSRSSWPEELHAFENAMSKSDDAKLGNIEVYCLQDWIDTHHVWRFDISRQAYDSLKQGFNTTSLATLDDRYFWSKPRVRWWDPDPKADAEYVEWFGFSSEVVTMYDKKSGVLYGYSQNDF
jgi:hypothetical protein